MYDRALTYVMPWGPAQGPKTNGSRHSHTYPMPWRLGWANQNRKHHQASNPAGRATNNARVQRKDTLGSTSWQLDDMLSIPFDPHIISYEPPKGFLVPKLTIYDGTSDLFDHWLHYWKLMTLDIRNDVPFNKVFPTSLHGSTLPWFHHLPQNSINSFLDVSEVFISDYLYSACQKHNISTL